MDAPGYALMLKALLPPGTAWNSYDQTDGATALDGMISALAQEPERIDADAVDALIEQVIPDSTGADLDAWENVVGPPTSDLSDAQRLARIQGILIARGIVTRADLELTAQRYADDANVTLQNRAWPPFVSGTGAAGSPIGRKGAYTWALRYMPSKLEAAPNAFEDWTSTLAVAQDVEYSPISDTQVADRVTGTLAGLDYVAGALIQDTVDGDVVRVTIWAKATAEPCTLTLSIQQRDGSIVDSMVGDLKASLWQKFTVRGSVGSGGSSPQLNLSWTDNSTIYLSEAFAGIANLQVEADFGAHPPIHTRGVYMVQGEDE